MTSPKRERAAGDLEAALLPVAEEHGRAFVRYSEAEKTEDASFAKAAFETVGGKAAMEALLQAGRGKSWPRAAVKQAVQCIFNAKHEAWNITNIEEEWILALECRLMNMQRHLQQAMSKKQAVAWLQQMPYYSLVLQYKGEAAVAGSAETRKTKQQTKREKKQKNTLSGMTQS